MRRPRASIGAGALAAALAMAALPPAAEGELELGGYLKNHSVVFRLPESKTAASDLPLPGISQFRLRVFLAGDLSPDVSFQAAYDLSPRIQDTLFFRASPFIPSPEAGDYRAADFRSRLVPAPGKPAGSFGLYHNLDRLSLSVKMTFGDLILGRQPVAWGSGRITNPTDLIAPFSFQELDKEERFGVDAVRLRIPLDALSELDAGAVFGRDLEFKRSAFFLRGKVNVLETDAALLLLGFREDLLLGLDLARSLGGAGVWLEGACVFPDALNGKKPKASSYARLTVGIDRSLSDRAYAFFEYHYNSAGSSEPGDYTALFSRPAYTRGAAYLMGRHYLAAGLTWQATPLIPVSGLLLWNATDGSLALSPQAEYNIAENIYLGAGAFVGVGRPPLRSPFDATGTGPVLDSEFGSYPDFVFLSFRVYF